MWIFVLCCSFIWCFYITNLHKFLTQRNPFPDEKCPAIPSKTLNILGNNFKGQEILNHFTRHICQVIIIKYFFPSAESRSPKWIFTTAPKMYHSACSELHFLRQHCGSYEPFCELKLAFVRTKLPPKVQVKGITNWSLFVYMTARVKYK